MKKRGMTTTINANFIRTSHKTVYFFVCWTEIFVLQGENGFVCVRQVCSKSIEVLLCFICNTIKIAKSNGEKMCINLNCANIFYLGLLQHNQPKWKLNKIISYYSKKQHFFGLWVFLSYDDTAARTKMKKKERIIKWCQPFMAYILMLSNQKKYSIGTQIDAHCWNSKLAQPSMPINHGAEQI